MFTADDRRLGLHSRQQVEIRVRVFSIRQGRSTAARGGHATQKVVRMRNKPETEEICAHGRRY